jgi:hypothetical protein
MNPNLSIIARCNRRCSYCFATEPLADAGLADQVMSWETFENALDYLERSDISQVKLLGGEPTLHRDFARMVDRALERGFNLLVFSGGLMPEVPLRRLEQVPADRLTVLVNVLAPGEGRPSEYRRQADVYRRLSRRVLLGYNITAPDAPFDFLLDLIREHDLRRTIRLGLAHPILVGSNRFLHARDYREVGRRVAEFDAQARRLGFEVDFAFDCGWVPCMFPEAFLESLRRSPQGRPAALSASGHPARRIGDLLLRPDGPSSRTVPATRDRDWVRTRSSGCRRPTDRPGCTPNVPYALAAAW